MGSYSIRNVGIVNEIDRAEKDLQFMKSRQFVGKRTLATKISRSPFYVSDIIYTYDFESGLDVPIGQAIYENLVTFKADQQTAPFGVLTVEIYDMAGNLQENDPPEGAGARLRNMLFLPNAVSGGTLQWDTDIPYISGYNTTGTPFQVKFVVAATDSGVVVAEDWAGYDL